jgi:formylglycine-generating enzyme required for sulfatase activity
VKPAVANVLLFPGDRLNLTSSAHVRLVVLSDLHQEWLVQGREATVGRKGCSPAAAVEQRSHDVMMRFVRLPKGAFFMGGGGGKVGTRAEIQEDFEIAAHVVTQGQWQVVMGNNPSAFSRHGSNQGSVSGISAEELKLFPVEQVTWNDAQEFLKNLNEKERGGGYWYRLPTEAEWEYACRGGATSEKECSYGRPTQVGSYPPNKVRLCDMHGNVWQWCGDISQQEGSARVYRGGGWSDYGRDCQVAVRDGSTPTSRGNALGFRMARVPVR